MPRLEGQRPTVWSEARADFLFEWRRTSGLASRAGTVLAFAGALTRLFIETIPTGEHPMRNMTQDLVYGWRRLRQAPSFTVVAVLTLGVALGANTALFSLVNSIVFSPVPGVSTSSVVGIALQGLDVRDGRVSPREFETLRAAAGPGFNHIAGWVRWNGAVSGAGQADAVIGEIVTAAYFQTLGVAPVAGSLFVDRDDVPGEGRVVISERLWRRWFAGNADAVGETLRSNGWPFTIVGVAPESFRGTSLPTLTRSDVWFSSGAASRLSLGDLWRTRADGRSLLVMGRLAPGVTEAAANAVLATIAPPTDGRPGTVRYRAVSLASVVMPSQFQSVGLAIGTAVLALAALVLVIACANLTNLFLARGASRSSEIAVRLANGATPARILRLVGVEVGVVVALASGVGWLIARGATAALASIAMPSLRGIQFAPALGTSGEVRVFVYMLLIAGLAASVAGWLPAWRAARTDPSVVFSGVGGSSWSSRRGSRLRVTLVATQVGVCVVLLLVAGLFVRSSLVSLSHDPGYDTSRGAVASINLELHGFTAVQGQRYFDRALEAARHVPGVQKAALFDLLPVGPENNNDKLVAEGQAPLFGDRGGLSSRLSFVSGEFFEMIRLPILAGRTFSDQDLPGAPIVAVVNQRLAGRLWPGQDPLGKRMTMGRRSLTVEVVGVVPDTDAHWPGVDWKSGPHDPYFFLSAKQVYRGEMSILVQGPEASESLVAPLHEAMRALDTSVAVFGVDTLANQAGVWLLPIRLAGIALAALGGAAWVIALVGLHGVIAYLVGQRTREIGVRMALGATTNGVNAMVLREAMRMMLIGAVPGIIAALAGASFLDQLLFGIAAYDPITFLTVPTALFAVGLLAALVPARRAAKVDPNVALRQL